MFRQDSIFPTPLENFNILAITELATLKVEGTEKSTQFIHIYMEKLLSSVLEQVQMDNSNFLNYAYAQIYVRVKYGLMCYYAEKNKM